MAIFKQHSLLIQLLSVYVLFVLVVLSGELGVNVIAEQHLRQDVQSSDQALARSIALQTSLQIQGAEEALNNLTQLVLPGEPQDAIAHTFQAFQIARPDVDHVYWMDPVGDIQVVWPGASVVDYTGGIGAEFAPPAVVPRARAANATIVEVGIAVETTYMPSVILARAVRTPQNDITGIVAVSLSLIQLSQPLQAIVQEQRLLHRSLDISIVDDRGELVATSESDPRLLQSHLLVNVLNELPGAAQAITGNTSSSSLAPDENGQDALFSAVPLRAPAWAVVVKRPASQAFAVIAELHFWLLLVALLFALGGLGFWLLLVNRVIRPLHILALEHQALPPSKQTHMTAAASLVARYDEVGTLARSLQRLEHDGLTKLGELHTLLDTSTAVVGSLDPYAVVGTIIAEARRLVDVQAAAVLVPDEQGVLRVLVSEGHSDHYDHALSLDPENVSSSAVLALREARPVQKIFAPSGTTSLSYEEGFRAVLAIPIISRHAGGVVLLVHRTEPIPFTQTEIDLLLTFANYATLAWEHAVLYERSDERLRQVAKENELLYQEALKTNEFKTTLLEAVSHEIRTPLAAIKGHASTLLQDDVAWSPADQHHFLQTISGEADRLAQLVSNLLDLSRQEAGILYLHRAPVAIADLVRQAIERQPHAGFRLVVAMPDDLPLVEVDSARIAVVLRNLLANAIAYGESEVRISATCRDDTVVVAVADNGPGISAGDASHIFERFYRTHAGQQRHSGGTGLGLSICKAFVAAHGGTIWAEQQASGMCIAFTLPLASPAILAAADRQLVEKVTP